MRRGTGLSPYRCVNPECLTEELRAGLFILAPEDRRAYKGEEYRLAETCDLCGSEMEWVPVQAAHDLLGEHFVLDLDGKQTKVSSLSELRNMEALSERKAANGDGVPLVVRAFSQDRSNRDVNSLRGTHYEKGRSVPVDKKTSRGLPITGGAYRPRE